MDELEDAGGGLPRHRDKKENDICHFIIMTPHTNIVFSVILQSM
ncbi:hypothetical protein [Bacillus subtilis]|nr:hypothetical protein [Bacillus subtilis]MEC1422245.1 hypothetical protein [Bacillus subtilis]